MDLVNPFDEDYVKKAITSLENSELYQKDILIKIM